MSAPRLLTPREVRDITGFGDKYFERLRLHGKGPSYVKLPNNRIRYFADDFDAWWSQQIAAGETVVHK